MYHNRMDAVNLDFPEFLRYVVEHARKSALPTFLLFPASGLSETFEKWVSVQLGALDVKDHYSFNEYLCDADKDLSGSVIYGCLEQVVLQGLTNEIKQGQTAPGFPAGASVFVWDADAMYDGRIRPVSVPLKLAPAEKAEENKIKAFVTMTLHWLNQALDVTPAEINAEMLPSLSRQFYQELVLKLDIKDDSYLRSMSSRLLASYIKARDCERGVDYIIKDKQLLWSTGQGFSPFVVNDRFVHGFLAVALGANIIQTLDGSHPISVNVSTWLLSRADVKLVGAFVREIKTGDVDFSSFYMVTKQNKTTRPDISTLAFETVNSPVIQNEYLQQASNISTGLIVILAATTQCLKALSALPENFVVMTHEAFVVSKETYDDAVVIALEMPASLSVWCRLANSGNVRYVLSKSDPRLPENLSLKWASYALQNAMQPELKTRKKAIGVWEQFWSSAQQIRLLDDSVLLDKKRYKVISQSLAVLEQSPLKAAAVLKVGQSYERLSQKRKVSKQELWLMFLFRLSTSLDQRQALKDLSPVYLSLSGEKNNATLDEIDFWGGLLHAEG